VLSCSSLATPIGQGSLGGLTYQWQEDVEDLEGYHVGGYHPVYLQDEYSDGRYRIVHKLRFGTYSTVWLAKDQHMNRYVAVKIIVAEASNTSSETRILRHLSNSQPNHTGKSYVSPILDEICIDGPNGRHLCLVSEPARCNVAASKEASTNWMFPIGIAQAVATQAVLELQDIHSCDVVHGGE
jgi:serine/threonine-protein kinase SRPK3